MTRSSWNRKPPRDDGQDIPLKKPFVGPLLKCSAEPYTPERIRPPRKRRRKHKGYTLVSPHRLWIFENNGNEGK